MGQIEQIQERLEAHTNVNSKVVAGVSKVCISFVAVLGFMVGLWSFACIVSGLISSGGPFQFISAWFKAVTGL